MFEMLIDYISAHAAHKLRIMYEHEKTEPILYMSQVKLKNYFAFKIVVIKIFSSIFEILNCFP